MDPLFLDFASAYNTLNGYLLATTLSPEPPSSDPARLYAFQRSSNSYSVQTDLRYKLQYNPDLQLDKKEANAWLDVFSVFYTFVGTLLSAEEAQNAGRGRDADWARVYDGWKDVVSALYKGYQANVFKADEKIASQRDSGLAVGGIQEEDAFNPDSKNEKLEDAARQINRIFGLCISDRYVPTAHPLLLHFLPHSPLASFTLS